VRISVAMKRLSLVALLLALVFSLGGNLKAQEPAKADDGGRKTTPAANSAEANQEEKDENAAYKHSAMVQKIGHAMGMSTETAATSFEVFNFAVLAFAIGFVLLKTLPKTFRDRSSAIQKELVDARSATEEASIRLNSVEARLAQLDGQIAEMKTQAEKDAAAEEKRFKAAAEDEKNKILATAEQEIASATQQAQRQLQQYAAGLAIEQAAKRLVISAETDRLLVQNFAQRLTDGKGGEN
jgi:F-type H+-transporting ATPase subunit b